MTNALQVFNYGNEPVRTIEIDGEYHNYTSSSKDLIRTRKIEKYDILIIRIPNTLIDSSFEKCCEYIDKIVKERL